MHVWIIFFWYFNTKTQKISLTVNWPLKLASYPSPCKTPTFFLNRYFSFCTVLNCDISFWSHPYNPTNDALCLYTIFMFLKSLMGQDFQFITGINFLLIPSSTRNAKSYPTSSHIIVPSTTQTYFCWKPNRWIRVAPIN